MLISCARRREAMKYALLVVLIATAVSVFAQGTVQPDAACGPKDINFSVKQQPSQSLAPAEPGKAHIYFIQDIGAVSCLGSCIITRIGLDGKWVGALEHNSYFYVSVDQERAPFMRTSASPLRSHKKDGRSFTFHSGGRKELLLSHANVR